LIDGDGNAISVASAVAAAADAGTADERGVDEGVKVSAEDAEECLLVLRALRGTGGNAGASIGKVGAIKHRLLGVGIKSVRRRGGIGETNTWVVAVVDGIRRNIRAVRAYRRA
jgi:hypothetical protein